MSQSLNQHVVEQLGGAIVGGDLAPGSVLTLDLLQERYGVSRTVARDAVKALEAQHLVEPRRRIGVSVLPASQWDVLAPSVIRWRLAGPERMQALAEISQLRIGIEPTAAALAARQATEADVATLQTAVDGMIETAALPDLEAYLAHDVTFHRTLLRASGNPMLATLGYVVEEVLTGRTHHSLMPPVPNPDAVALHRVVADAIASHDPDAAETAMRGIVAEAQLGAEEMARAERPVMLGGDRRRRP